MTEAWEDHIKLVDCEPREETMSELKMLTNGYEIVIAETIEEAKQIVRDMEIYEDDDGLEGEGWGEYIHGEFTFADGHGYKETRSPQEWIKERGKGYFASTEY